MNAKNALTLIVDTNLFLECRPLDELPWGDLEAASVELIISRPVQKELDEHKKNRSGRTFKKALATGKLLRGLVTSGAGCITINEEEPRVTLMMMRASRLIPDLAQELDPGFPDDAILLRLLEYREAHPERDVRLLTHDTGPMATAQSIGVPFIPIPDDWLMREQDDPVTRENRKLTSENERLRKREPRPLIRALDENGEVITRIDAEEERFSELTYTEIEALIGELKETFPVATDFGNADSEPHPVPPSTGLRRSISVTEFRPATEEEIRTYRDEQYPGWLDDCRDCFEKLHSRLHWRIARPRVDFELANGGTRPASNCLVTITALGDLEIFPPRSEDDDDDDKMVKRASERGLPGPPKPPRGHWVQQRRSSIDNILGVMKHDPLSAAHSLITPRDFAPFVPEKDKFYWRDHRPSIPIEVAEFECQAWRHNVAPENFTFDIFAYGDEETAGAIRCEVHAENLSDPVALTIPVTVRSRTASTFEKARELITRLSSAAIT